MKQLSTNTATYAILEHIKNNGSITSKEAFEKYGITRLSALIYNLRRYGFDIKSISCQTKTRYEKTINYVKYVMPYKED